MNFITPHSPGGASDNVARTVMPRLRDAPKQTIAIVSPMDGVACIKVK
jgi:tripartite-type tricarboxylate transporter receptor subunit TctC